MSTPSKRTAAQGSVVQPRDHPERGRLAGAVRAEQRDDLALFDHDREVLQGWNDAVADLGACDLEQRHQESSDPGVVFAVCGAEVGVDHDRVPLDLGRRSLRDHLAEVQHEDPLRHRHNELHVVLDQQHGDGELGVDLADQAGQLDLLGRVGPRGRLVQQQHLRVRPERPGDLEAPPVPVGQRAREVVGLPCEPDELQQLQGPEIALVLLAPGAGQSEHGADGPGVLLGLDPDLHVLERRQRTEHPGGLERPRDPEPVHLVGLAADHAHGVPVLRGEPDRALLGPVHARQTVEQRGLPGAVGADDRQHLSPVQVQRHVAQARDAAEAQGHVLDGEQDVRRLRWGHGGRRVGHSVSGPM